MRPSALGARRPRSALSATALLLVVVALVPPFATAARTTVWVEALQFALFAFVVPPLAVLGAPWSTWSRVSGLAVSVAARRRRSRREALSMLYLALFVAAVVAWRIPPSVNALSRLPGLSVLEMLTLVATGIAFWLELVDSPPLHPRATRPQRIALAAVAMWATWFLAYLLGFSRSAWFHAYPHVAGHGLGVFADQSFATGVLWAASGLALTPIVFVNLIRWLSAGDDPDEEIRTLVKTEARRHRGDDHFGPLRGPKASGSHA